MDRIIRFTDLVGLTLEKNIIINKLVQGNLPKFMIMTGPPGTGKSSLAELIAMSQGCTSTNKINAQPCLQCENCRANLSALVGNGISNTMKKINIPEFYRKEDAKSLIKGIFKMETTNLNHTTYILEEFDGIDLETQKLFLEEVNRIQDGVTVILCNMVENGIHEALLSRAKLVFRPQKLTRDECRVLIRRKSDALGVTISQQDAEFLINKTKSSAREIVNVLENLTDQRDFSSVIRRYFNVVNTDHYVSFFIHCTSDFYTLVAWIEDLSASVNLVNFWNGMQEFIRDSIFYLYGKAGTMFTQGEKAKITKTIGKLGKDKLQALLKYSHYKVKTDADAEYRLLQMETIIMPPKTISQHKESAEHENRTADKNAREVEKKAINMNNDQSRMEVKKITPSFLTELADTDVVYEG